MLSPAKPVTLTWDNDNGLVFTRTIAINDDYIITFDDVITSSLDTALTVFPYGLVRRHGTPPTTGIYILHEGALGVFDETLSEEDYDDIKDADGGVSKIDPEQPGGWIGFTDKYWLAAVLPDQDRNYSFAFKSLNGPTDRYQVDFIDTAGMVVAPGAVSPRKAAFLPERKRSRFLIIMPKSLAFRISISPLILAGSIS